MSATTRPSAPASSDATHDQKQEKRAKQEHHPHSQALEAGDPPLTQEAKGLGLEADGADATAPWDTST